jgi:hypothetical protein
MYDPWAWKDELKPEDRCKDGGAHRLKEAASFLFFVDDEERRYQVLVCKTCGESSVGWTKA